LPNYALLVEYDGTCFHGFQKQINSFTVQDALENALKILLKPKEDLRFHVAGRTDTGVHATGMICNFFISKKIEDLDLFRISLNALAGGKVSCLGMAVVPEKFHSRFSCTAREYEFKIIYSKNPHPIWEKRAVWVKETIDWNLVMDQLQYLKGEKNFKALAKQMSIKGKPTKKEFQHASIVADTYVPYIINFRFRADGFLHNMIRIITGTLVDIGTGKIQGRNLGDIIQSEDRSLAGKTLPPYGLYFARAYYDDFPEIDNLYERAFQNPLNP
jgi:tRNA pseudouridine38-40 synthase